MIRRWLSKAVTEADGGFIATRMMVEMTLKVLMMVFETDGDKNRLETSSLLYDSQK